MLEAKYYRRNRNWIYSRLFFETENEPEEIIMKNEGVQKSNKETVNNETQTNTIKGLTEQLDRYKGDVII